MTKIVACCLFAIAACSGGGSKPPSTSTPVADPVPMPDPAVGVFEPTQPVDPPPPLPKPPPAKPDPATTKTDLLATEMAAYTRAKPVFDQYCASCHSKDGKKQSAKKLGHFDMTTYPFGGHHAMEISGEIRAALGVTGKKPTMPLDKKGIVKGEELEAIKAWADAFDTSHAAGAHAGHDTHGGHAH